MHGIRRLPQISAILRPVATLPVKLSLSMSACDQRGAGLAVALHQLEDAVRQPRFLEELLDEASGEGRHFGGLEHDGVARDQRLHGRVERQDEREVPRRDDADHAERPVAELELLRLHQVHGHRAIGEDPPRALRVELKCVTSREDLGREGFETRLAGLRADHVDEVFLAREQHADRALEVARARGDPELGPLALRLARALDGGGDVGRRLHVDLADGFERRGVREAEAPPAASRRLDLLDDRHAAPSRAPPLLGDSARCYGTPAGKVNLSARIARRARRVRRGGVQAQEPALFRFDPALRAAFPRHPIVTGPTPVEALPLAGLPEGALFVKRDERCSPLYGGNKPRKLEWILGAALARGSRRLVTTGGLGTHHGLATTILARDAGLATTLVLVMQPVTAAVQRSLLLDAAWGAELRWGRNLPGAAAQVAARARARDAAGRATACWCPPAAPRRAASSASSRPPASSRSRCARACCPSLPRSGSRWEAAAPLAGLVAGLALAGLRSRVVGVLVTDILPPSPRRLARMARATLRELRRASPRLPRARDPRGRFRPRALAAGPRLRRRDRRRARRGRRRGRPRPRARDDLHRKMSGRA